MLCAKRYKGLFQLRFLFFALCIFLIAPFLLLTNIFASLAITLMNAVIVIFIFTFYISIAKDLNFMRRFAEMVLISLGVAGLTFVIGMLINLYLGTGI